MRFIVAYSLTSSQISRHLPESCEILWHFPAFRQSPRSKQQAREPVYSILSMVGVDNSSSQEDSSRLTSSEITASLTFSSVVKVYNQRRGTNGTLRFGLHVRGRVYFRSTVTIIIIKFLHRVKW